MTAYSLGLRFEEVVSSSPDAVALICEGDHFTFSELNKSANRLARWLTSQGVSKGAVVCLELPKIAEAYALAIACIKIGAPYAFLDPAAPAERARLMLERCRPALIVSVREGSGPRTVIGDAEARAALHHAVSKLDDDNLPLTSLITGADPAYVMFTSGSTGEPKGVVIPHQGVLHLIAWAKSDLGIGSHDRLTNVNPIYFDNSVFDIYAGLLNGAAIVALDALKGRPPAELVAEITRHRCTFFFAVPTLFMFLDSMHLLSPEWLPSVSRFMFGGEGFPLARLRRFHDSFAGKAKLINCYGPTETSCICSGFEIVESVFDTDDGLAPLGRLNPNFSYRILDDEMKPVPAGTAGELWLGMMPDSLKAADVLRDPRVAIHSASDDSDGTSSWPGDAKLAGRLVEVPDEAEMHRMGGQPGHLFRVDINEVSMTHLGDPADHLLIEAWSPSRGLRRIKRL